MQTAQNKSTQDTKQRRAHVLAQKMKYLYIYAPPIHLCTSRRDPPPGLSLAPHQRSSSGSAAHAHASSTALATASSAATKDSAAALMAPDEGDGRRFTPAGTRTALITCATPLEASTSAITTVAVDCAEYTVTPVAVRRIVMGAPDSVVTVRFVFRGRSVEYTRPVMTCVVSTAVSAVRLPVTDAGTGANAAFVGANTVNGPLGMLRAVTRFAAVSAPASDVKLEATAVCTRSIVGMPTLDGTSTVLMRCTTPLVHVMF